MHIKQEMSENSNARLFENLSQGCFIEYNNAYLYEYKNIVRKGTKPSSFNTFPSVVMEIQAYTQKLNQEFMNQKRGIIMRKSKSELWDLCQSS
jgi:hypothetical protein